MSRLAGQAGFGVRVISAPCMGWCDKAPVAAVGYNQLDCASTESVLAAIGEGHIEPEIPDYLDYDAYVKDGGYLRLQACVSGAEDVESVLTALEHSELRGLGGAGFPAGHKWRIVRGYPGPRLMAVNAHEGEPGTFKGRYYLERDPHRFIEDTFIDAYTEGFENFRKHIEGFTPEAMAPICRIDADTLRTVAHTYANAHAPIIFWGMGISQHIHGTDNSRCLIALSLITG